MQPDYSYALRVPTASTIYRRATAEESISALNDINRSLPADKSLPEEIRLLVNKEVRANPSYEKVHSTWTSLTDECELWSGGIPKEGMNYDKLKKSFYSSPDWFLSWREREEGTKVGLDRVASAADVLYRLRCYFPDIYTDTEVKDKSVWAAAVRHNQSNLVLVFTEHKANVSIYIIQGRYSIGFSKAGTIFTTDVIELLNTLFETVGDTPRFAYFHPTADADFPAADEHFLAVPAESLKPRVGDIKGETENVEPYHLWEPVPIQFADISSFKSILTDMKYNIKSREVDPVNGTANLTTIISSSLLFYRLICHFVCGHRNVNTTPPITSVWQVKLQHVVKDASIIFMDDRGLFDIRANGEEIEDVMDDISSLVNVLCSDKCCHPYDGVVAGCAA